MWSKDSPDHLDDAPRNDDPTGSSYLPTVDDHRREKSITPVKVEIIASDPFGLSPRLEVASLSLDLSPFSESFADLFDQCGLFSEDYRACPSIEVDLDENMNISYNVEVQDMKDLLPEWHDSDEVMVLSPKTRTAHERISDRTSNPASESHAGEPQTICANDFKLLHIILDASLATTYLCRHRETFKLYIVKAINKARVSAAGLMDRAKFESTVLRRISELHSVLLSPLCWHFEDKTSIYSVTDFYPGGSLFEYMTHDGVLDSEHAHFYASEIVEGLACLHAAHIVHCDLRPQNIMIDVHGHIVISGFEHAQLLDSTENGSFCDRLTDLDAAVYQAPEMILGWFCSDAVDCWSFGILLHMMLFGRHPCINSDDYSSFAAIHSRIVYSPLPFQSSEEVGWTAQDLIRKCLERNPAMRLGIAEIKKHVYFCSVDWRRVAAKTIPAPAVSPRCDRFSSLDDKNMTVDTMDRLFPLKLSNTDSTSQPENIDPFTPMPHRIVKKKVTNIKDQTHPHQLNEEQVFPKRLEKIAARLEPVVEISEEASNECMAIDLPAPGFHFSREHSVESDKDQKIHPGTDDFWDFLDADRNSLLSQSSLDHSCAPPPPLVHPRKLRKRHSYCAQDRCRFSSTLTLSSKGSRIPKKLHKKMRPVSTPLLRLRPSQPRLNLPSGLQQIGQGIGYSHQGSSTVRSKLSVATAVPRACQGMFFSALPTLRSRLSHLSLHKMTNFTQTHPVRESHDAPTGNRSQAFGSSSLSTIPACDDDYVQLISTVNIGPASPLSVESNGPETPEIPYFKGSAQVVVEDLESSLRLVSSSGLRLLM